MSDTSEDVSETEAHLLEETQNNSSAVITNNKKRRFYATKCTLREKRLIVREAYSEPKQICLTARKYNIANGTIHHRKHLFDNAMEDEERNMDIAHAYNARSRAPEVPPLGYSSMDEFRQEQ
ncbi:hypothetical protein ACA910_008840 [Epithemia clementina (nom. ined.)]